MTLQACYLSSQIDLKKVRDRYPGRCQHLSDPMHMTFGDGKLVCITSFGVMVFWPFDSDVASQAITALKPFVSDRTAVDEVKDHLVVSTAMNESKVLFDEIWIEEDPSFDQISLISQLLAQSVALEHLENEVDGALDRVQKQVRSLRKRGRLAISDKSVFKSIGFAMDIRHRVLTNLALFDKPDAIWESEELERLYTQLYNHFDLEDRLRTIQRKLTFLSDNTSFLYEFISTRKSHKLEWIIIYLIAFEIALFLGFELFLH